MLFLAFLTPQITKRHTIKMLNAKTHFSFLSHFSLLSSLPNACGLAMVFFFSLSLMVRWSQCSVLGSWWWVTVRFLFFLSFYFCCCLWLRWIWLVVGGSDGRWMWWLWYGWMWVWWVDVEGFFFFFFFSLLLFVVAVDLASGGRRWWWMDVLVGSAENSWVKIWERKR